MISYKCDVGGYSGEISFPSRNQFGLEHWITWQEAQARVPDGMPRTIANHPVTAEWRGAIDLIRKYGDWRIDGVNVSSLADNPDSTIISLELIQWVRMAVANYLGPLVTLPKSPQPSETAMAAEPNGTGP